MVTMAKGDPKASFQIYRKQRGKGGCISFGLDMYLIIQGGIKLKFCRL